MACRFGDPQNRQVGCRVPAGELGVEGLIVVGAHMQSVFAAERVSGGDDDAVGVDETAGRARRRPCTWTTEGATAATASAIWFENSFSMR